MGDEPIPGSAVESAANSVLLSIVIVNWNTADLLVSCLRSLRDNAGEISNEVFVVDNGSDDNSVSVINQQFGWVKLIQNDTNVGFSQANNQALALCNSPYILLLNSDTEVQPGALKTLKEALEAHRLTGAVGPRMLNPDGSWQNSYGSLPTVLDDIIGPYRFDNFTKPWGKYGGEKLQRQMLDEDLLPVERVSFACTMIRREALDDIGMLDEQYSFYSEDYDWFIRLHRAGWQVLFCPQASVIHHWGGSSSRRSIWARRQLYRSKRIYYRKHFGRGTEGLLRIGLMIRFVIRLITSLIMGALNSRDPIRRDRIHQTLRLLRDLIQPLD